MNDSHPHRKILSIGLWCGLFMVIFYQFHVANQYALGQSLISSMGSMPELRPPYLGLLSWVITPAIIVWAVCMKTYYLAKRAGNKWYIVGIVLAENVVIFVYTIVMMFLSQ